jgi:hypothetical protein
MASGIAKLTLEEMLLILEKAYLAALLTISFTCLVVFLRSCLAISDVIILFRTSGPKSSITVVLSQKEIIPQAGLDTPCVLLTTKRLSYSVAALNTLSQSK